MKFKRITSADDPLYTEAIQLYESSFPFYERREEASQRKVLPHPLYHFDAVCDQGQFIGEILYWEFEEFRYIEHFCIQPSMRNQQYGKRILAALQEKPRILEIDPPIDDLSKRRKGFYERCGFVENPYRHIQIPYHKGDSDHELVVMSSPRALAREEYDTFLKKLQLVVMADMLFMLPWSAGM